MNAQDQIDALYVRQAEDGHRIQRLQDKVERMRTLLEAAVLRLELADEEDENPCGILQGWRVDARRAVEEHPRHSHRPGDVH